MNVLSDTTLSGKKQSVASEGPVRKAALHLSHAGSAFFFPIYGTVLLETGAAVLHAGIFARAVLAVLCVAFAIIVHRRLYQTFVHAASLNLRDGAPRSKMARWFSVGQPAIFLAGGAIAGNLILSSFTISVLVVVGLLFLPWSRVCSTRRRFFAAGLLLPTGAGLALILSYAGVADAFVLLFAGWAFWVAGFAAFLLCLKSKASDTVVQKV